MSQAAYFPGGYVEDEELEAGNIRVVDNHIRGRVRGLVRLGRFRGPAQEGDFPAVRRPGESRHPTLDGGGLGGFPSAQVDEPDLVRTVPVGEESQNLPVGRPSRRLVPAGTRREPKRRPSGRLGQPDAAGGRVLGQVDFGKDIGHQVSGGRDPSVLDVPDAEQVLDPGRVGCRV